jgi:hypothetical protein
MYALLAFVNTPWKLCCFVCSEVAKFIHLLKITRRIMVCCMVVGRLSEMGLIIWLTMSQAQ